MADTSFFGRLTKLFRAQAVVTIDKEGKRKVVDTICHFKTLQKSIPGFDYFSNAFLFYFLLKVGFFLYPSDSLSRCTPPN